MNIPQLRFPEFQGDWEKKKLGEVSEINPTNKNLPNKFIYIDLESVSNGELLKENEITIENAPSRAQRILQVNDVLFQMVRPYQKNNLFFDKEGIYVASTGYAQIRTKQYPKYLFQYLHFQTFVDRVIERCTGTSYPSINSTDLSNIEFSYPSIEEQTKIASFLTAVDEKIQALKKKHSLLLQYKNGVMQKLFSQELRFKDEKGNDFPEWEEKKLNEVLTIQGGFAFKSELFKNGNTKVFRIGDIDPNISVQNFTGVYSSETPNEKYLVKKNDFLMALSGATFGKVGKIIDDGFGYINQRVATFRTNECLEFYYQVVQTNEFKNYINSIPTASAQPNISNDDIGNYLTLIPCLQEQIKIAEFLNGIDGRIYKHSLQIQSIENWKKGLLQKMFC